MPSRPVSIGLQLLAAGDNILQPRGSTPLFVCFDGTYDHLLGMHALDKFPARPLRGCAELCQILPIMLHDWWSLMTVCICGTRCCVDARAYTQYVSAPFSAAVMHQDFCPCHGAVTGMHGRNRMLACLPRL